MVAFNHGHIEPILPIVSDLALLPPESSLFSLFLNLESIISLMFAIIRFESNEALFEKCKEISKESKQCIKTKNKLLLITGSVMFIGHMIVANFRCDEINLIHSIGAIFAFGLAFIDMFIQSRIDYGLAQNSIAIVRTVLSILMVCFNLVTVGSMLLTLGNTGALDAHYRLKWNSSQEGYYYHIISSISEWILMFILSVYYFTFYSHFNCSKFNTELIVSDYLKNNW